MAVNGANGRASVAIIHPRRPWAGQGRDINKEKLMLYRLRLRLRQDRTATFSKTWVRPGNKILSS